MAWRKSAWIFEKLPSPAQFTHCTENGRIWDCSTCIHCMWLPRIIQVQFLIFYSLMTFLWTGNSSPSSSWLQLPSLFLVMSPNCRLKCIWAVALTGAASRKPLVEGSTAVTRNMGECTSLDRRPLSNCWTKRWRFCLTKYHLSNLTFRISCSKMERALLIWELSEREGFLTSSVGATHCRCVQLSFLQQVNGIRVLSRQFSRGWAAKVYLSYWDRTQWMKSFYSFLPRMLSRKLPIRLTQKKSSMCVSLLPMGISSSFSHTLWCPYFPLLWLLINFWNSG